MGKIEFIEPELVEKDYREFTSKGFSSEDEEQLAWCQQWELEHQKKKRNRMWHMMLFKVNVKCAWKHLIGWVKGTGGCDDY